jgi:hypothetical protein
VLFLLRPLSDGGLLPLLRHALPLLQASHFLPSFLDFTGTLGKTRGGREGGFERFLKVAGNEILE